MSNGFFAFAFARATSILEMDEKRVSNENIWSEGIFNIKKNLSYAQ